MLFNIYIEELSNELEARNITHLLYADDLILIGDIKQTLTGIRVTKEWCQNNNMKVRTEKSGCLPIIAPKHF